MKSGADVKANKLGPVNVAVQGGTIMNDASGATDSKAVGAKVSSKVSGVNLSLAYSKVNSGIIDNVGTGVKTPLYTQMILNQGAIKTDNDTVVLAATMPAGAGKFIAKYDMTTDNSAAGLDYQELDLIYKFKALGTNMLAAYVMADKDGQDKLNVLRVWTRYNF